MTTHYTVIRFAIAIAALLVLTSTAFVQADTRGSDRGTAHTLTPTQTATPAAAPMPLPSPQQGGITSTTEGNANSGSNTGGVVTTGNESVDVHEVNLGPTNNPPPVVVTPTPMPPSATCDSRTRSGCGQDGGRVR